MSMIENTFKLKHKAVEKIVKYSNQMSLRTKIRQGYIVMIILFFFHICSSSRFGNPQLQW